MADGVKGAAGLVGEALIKPVADEFGKAIEQGVQSLNPLSNNTQATKTSADTSALDPTSVQQREMNDQSKIAAWRQRLTWIQNNLDRPRQALLAKRNQEQKAKVEQKQVEQEKKLEQKQVKAKQDQAITNAQTSVENKNRGGG